MSVTTSSACWAALSQLPDLGCSAKLALLAMADYADDDGGSIFPSMRTLGEKMGVTRSQAVRAVRDLRERGIVTPIGKTSGGAHGDTTRYRINLEKLTGSKNATRGKSATRSKDAPDGWHKRHPTRSNNATQTVNEPSGNQQRAPNGFDEFWQAYPRKKARQDALKAWGALRPDVDLQGTMLGALERQKLTPDWRKNEGQYIPHPAKWLRQRLWEDHLDVTLPDEPKRVAI